MTHVSRKQQHRHDIEPTSRKTTPAWTGFGATRPRLWLDMCCAMDLVASPVVAPVLWIAAYFLNTDRCGPAADCTLVSVSCIGLLFMPSGPWALIILALASITPDAVLRWGCSDLETFRRKGVDILRRLRKASRLLPEDWFTCVVCMDGERDVVFTGCGHLVCCSSCAGRLVKCPICRKAAPLCEHVFVRI